MKNLMQFTHSRRVAVLKEAEISTVFRPLKLFFKERFMIFHLSNLTQKLILNRADLLNDDESISTNRTSPI